jgi:hypothetical protein
MRLYFDACCLNRPFDDQFQYRIRMESEAVRTLLAMCRDGLHRWVASDALVLEVSKMPDALQRAAVLDMLRFADERLPADRAAFDLAAELAAEGLGGFDATHLSVATLGACDILLTTDDRFIARSARLRRKPLARVMNPVVLVTELGQT